MKNIYCKLLSIKYVYMVTLRIEILILIIVVSIILFSHLFCSCSTVSAYEAFTALKNVKKEKLTMNKNKKNAKEGFTGANTNGGFSAQYKLNDYTPLDTSSWFTQDLTNNKSQGVQNILNRPSQPVPLPEGQMLMFANTKFKPECCPNSYSNSTGCACMTVQQYNYLIDRGGNNVPYSEY